MVLGVGVEAGAGGRAADAQAAQALGRAPDALGVALHGPGIGAELLPQPHRHGILQVGAPRLDHVVELDGLVAQLGGQAVDLAGQFVQPPQAAQADGGGDGVVGALRHVDVVVGVHRLVRGHRCA